MSATAVQAAETFNTAKITYDKNEKVTLLHQVKELVVHKEPALVGQYLPQVLEMQMEPQPVVKRFVADFIAESLQIYCSPQAVRLCIDCLANLTREGETNYVRQALAATSVALRVALGLYATQPHDPYLKDLWAAALQLQGTACGPGCFGNGEAGPLNWVKLKEQMVLLFTAEYAPMVNNQQPPPRMTSLPDAASLVQEAARQLRGLVEKAKLPGALKLSGPVLIVVLKALGTISVQRPQFMGKILPTLITLAMQGPFKVPGNVKDQDGKEASIGNTLRQVFVQILKSRVEASVPWRTRLVETLNKIGAKAMADQAMRYIERQDYKESKLLGKDRGHQRGPDGARPDPAKRQRVEPQAVPQSSRSSTERTPTPEVNGTAVSAETSQVAQGPPKDADIKGSAPAPGAQQPPVGVPRVNLAGPLGAPLGVSLPPVVPPRATTTPPLVGPVRPPAPLAAPAAPSPAPSPLTAPGPGELLQLQRVLETLVENKQNDMLDSVLGKLNPVVLVEVVLSFMDNLPPEPPSEEPTVVPEARGGKSEAPGPVSVPMEVVDDRAAGQLSTQQGIVMLADIMKKEGPMGAAEVPPLTAPSGGDPAGPSSSSRSQAEPESKLPLGSTPPVTAPVVFPPRLQPQVGPPRPHPLPLPLSAAQLRDLRHSAVKRILMTQNLPVRNFRQLLLSRLATKAPAADGLADIVLQHVIAHYHSSHGHDLALRWLYSLFISHCGADASAPDHGQRASEEAVVAVEEVGGMEGEDVAMAQANAEVAEPDVDPSLDADHRGGQQDVGPSGRVAPDLVGTPYEDVFLALLEGLRENLPVTDRAITNIIMEAPVVPVKGTALFLSDLCSSGPDWATVALSTAKLAIDNRPPLRGPLLEWVLEKTHERDSDVRSKAIRLVANKLFAKEQLKARIEAFARGCLEHLLSRAKALAQVLVQPDAETPAAPQGGDEKATSNGPGDAAVNLEDPEEEETMGAQYCGLYLALCTKKPVLLRDLLAMYKDLGAPVQAAIHKYIGGLARALGATSPVLLDCLRDPPPGCSKMLLQMVQVLTEQAVPPRALLDACLHQYAVSHDVQFMAAVIVGMTKEQVLNALPQLLDLQPPALRVLYRKLTTANPPGEALFSPSEILVALHTLDVAKEGIPLKRVITSVDTALHSPETFPQQTVAQALQQLEVLTPLPPLFMRTVILTLQTSPKLLSFAMQLMTRLISRQVWSDSNQWRGFCLCAEKTAPHSFSVLLQLPAGVLDTALKTINNQKYWAGLAKFATSEKCDVPVFQSVRAVLQKYLDQAAAQQLEAAKKAELAAKAEQLMSGAAGGGEAEDPDAWLDEVGAEGEEEQRTSTQQEAHGQPPQRNMNGDGDGGELVIEEGD